MFPDLFTNNLGCTEKYLQKFRSNLTMVQWYFKARPVFYAKKTLIEKELDHVVKNEILVETNYSDCASPIVFHYKKDGVDEKSQEITDINTHRGLFQYTRLPFGLASAPSIVQHTMDQIPDCLPMVYCYLDDIMLVYCGVVISKEGIRKPLSRLKAIHGMPEPENESELRCFASLDIVLAMDASSCGIRAMISHKFHSGEERPNASASRVFTAAEKNYFGNEKEGLEIGIQRCAIFLYGISFEIHYRHSEENANDDAFSWLPLQKYRDDVKKEYPLIAKLSAEFNAINRDNLVRGTLKDSILSESSFVFERFNFYRRERLAEESLTNYALVLRRAAKNCRFVSKIEESLRDKFAVGQNRKRNQEKLFMRVKDTDTPFSDVFKFTTSLEGAEKDRRKLEDVGEENCLRCSESWHNNLAECRCHGKTCHFCRIKGHLQKACLKQKKKTLEVKDNKQSDRNLNQTSDSDIILFPIVLTKLKIINKVKAICIYVKLNGVLTQMDFDTGATVSCIDEEIRRGINKHPMGTPIVNIIKPDGSVRIHGDFKVTISKYIKLTN
ncbi:hypothetical protein RF11_01366 [Thelohanellus kitauei]|uniref:Uncharacterized protein n=1 Tax=Thelohanellus kitauei TaxID=669202 RepID=A0A0C2NCX2_THEKT|nr:hypothetical protein RF11_01366 [Thelohanellus kitauei]